MAIILRARKNLTVNPLKLSPPLGGATAFMGMAGSVPLLHGGQGCTAFAKVLQVRHFREPSPIQTTAMDEITTILGGLDNLEQGCLAVFRRNAPRVIGVCTTGLTETRGEDLAGDLKRIKERNPELAGVELIGASTPDYTGSLETGWALAVTAVIEALAGPCVRRQANRINILAGSHLTPGDIEEMRDLVEAFGLEATILPDLSGSLDGHVPERHMGTSYGGVTVEQVRAMGTAIFTLALGEQMRGPARALEAKTGIPWAMIDRLTGLGAVDALVTRLQDLSGRPAPAGVRRRRSQLADAMLDGHFQFAGLPVALAAEPDLLFALASVLAEMGASVVAAIAPYESPVLARLPVEEVVIGDLDDLENRAQEKGAALLVSRSHAAPAAQRLGVPLFRAGFPILDRLGAQHVCSVGYRGTRDLIYAIGNLMLGQVHEARPDDWPLPGFQGETPHAQAAAH